MDRSATHPGHVRTVSTQLADPKLSAPPPVGAASGPELPVAVPGEPCEKQPEKRQLATASLVPRRDAVGSMETVFSAPRGNA
eukprot:1489259-Pyramimonas_sp.AAC.1